MREYNNSYPNWGHSDRHERLEGSRKLILDKETAVYVQKIASGLYDRAKKAGHSGSTKLFDDEALELPFKINGVPIVFGPDADVHFLKTQGINLNFPSTTGFLDDVNKQVSFNTSSGVMWADIHEHGPTANSRLHSIGMPLNTIPVKDAHFKGGQ